MDDIEKAIITRQSFNAINGTYAELNDRERIVLAMLSASRMDPCVRQTTEDELASYMGYTKAQIRYGLAGLVRKGYVRRTVERVRGKDVPVYDYLDRF